MPSRLERCHGGQTVTAAFQTMMKSLKALLKPRLVHFVSRHLDLGFKPCRSITSQQIRARFRGEELIFEADFRTPLYETVNEVVAYDCYQFAKVAFSPSSAAVVIDVGANIGISSIALARLYAGRIYAFEPIASNIKYLQANLRANRVENVECRKCALGVTQGQATMAINPNQSVSPYVVESGRAKIPAWYEMEKVQMVTLSSFLEEIGFPLVDLLKMDCEGAEYGLVKDLAKLDHEKIRAITMEVHDLDRQRNYAAMRAALIALGYTVTYKPELLGRPTLHHLLAIHR